MAVRDRNEVADQAERFDKLRNAATLRLTSASRLLAWYWQDPNAVAGIVREGERRDGEDAPGLMDADAIEGLILIVRQAERSIAEIISGVYETAYDNALAASNLVRGAINLLEAAAIAEDGRLSTFGAFSVAWTLDAACGLLATVKAPAEWNAAHSNVEGEREAAEATAG